MGYTSLANSQLGTKLGRVMRGVLQPQLSQAQSFIIFGYNELALLVSAFISFPVTAIYVKEGGDATDIEHNKLVGTWKSNCEQIVIKARYSLRDDKKTLEEIEHYAQLIGIKTN